MACDLKICMVFSIGAFDTSTGLSSSEPKSEYLLKRRSYWSDAPRALVPQPSNRVFLVTFFNVIFIFQEYIIRPRANIENRLQDEDEDEEKTGKRPGDRFRKITHGLKKRSKEQEAKRAVTVSLQGKRSII